MRDDRVYLRHLADSLDLVGQYLAGAGGAADERLFYEDPRTQDAVLRRMETLPDAATHLSDTLKARHPAVPWRRIGDFRNVLAHGYSGIRLDEVWRAITVDLPPLRSVVDEELDRLSSP